jgi:hypothetical protein
MPGSSRQPSPPAAPTAPPTDPTRWMAIVIEFVAIAAAVLFAYQHAAT